MNKKGFTLFEAIASLVILGIIVTLLAFVVSAFIRANDRISISSLANEEGHFVVRKIQEDLADLNPTTFETCPVGVCYIFEKEFSYDYNEVSEEIELVVYDEPLTYKIQMSKSILYINDVEYAFDGFVLHSDSSLELVTELNSNFISLNIVLESEKSDLFEFLMNYSFESSVIPDA